MAILSSLDVVARLAVAGAGTDASWCRSFAGSGSGPPQAPGGQAREREAGFQWYSRTAFRLCHWPGRASSSTALLPSGYEAISPTKLRGRHAKDHMPARHSHHGLLPRPGRETSRPQAGSRTRLAANERVARAQDLSFEGLGSISSWTWRFSLWPERFRHWPCPRRMAMVQTQGG